MKFTTTVVGTTSDICSGWRASLAAVTKDDDGYQVGSHEKAKGKELISHNVRLFKQM